jgi:hypothetical protein
MNGATLSAPLGAPPLAGVAPGSLAAWSMALRPRSLAVAVSPVLAAVALVWARGHAIDSLLVALGPRSRQACRPVLEHAAARGVRVLSVPTMAEIGLPDAQATSWGAVMAPAGTPAPVVARFNAAIREALAQQPVKDRLAAAGAEGVASTPEDLATYLRAESAKWARVVREAQITVN